MKYVNPFETVRNLLSRIEPPSEVLSWASPPGTENWGNWPRALFAGAMVGALSIAGLVAAGSLVLFLLAMGVLYFLMTYVLGVRIDVDPKTFFRDAQKYADPYQN